MFSTTELSTSRQKLERDRPVGSRVADDAPTLGASGARDGYDALLTPH